MIIKMDTRSVNAFKLSIWSNSVLLFEDVIFSMPSVSIELPDFQGGSLEVKWCFYFTEEEKEIIKESRDIPKEGFLSYYIENDVENSNGGTLIGSFMQPAEGIYYTVIENIKPSCQVLKMTFVESDIADGILLLTVSSKGDPKFGNVHFRRREKIDDIMKLSKSFFDRKIKKLQFFTFSLIVVFILWCIVWFLILKDYSFSTMLLSLLLGGFVAFNTYNYWEQTKSYRELTDDCERIRAFKLVGDRIQPISEKYKR